MAVPVIDLFAGPGGLSEGFERYRSSGTKAFRCVLSVEKEKFAHRTLLLRAFFRQFERPPKEYFAHLRGELSLTKLYKLYPDEHEAAKAEAIKLALARRNRERIDRLIRKTLQRHRKKWVLIGGPPCQAYSLVGRARRSREDRQVFENDGRHFLYKEYLRILKKFRPPVFVMENVKGLLSSSTKGGETFKKILEDFAAAGYTLHSFVKNGNGDELEPMDYVITAERFDIPQSRHRVILLGVRKQLERGSRRLRETNKHVPIQSAIGDLPRIRSQVMPPSRDSYETWQRELNRLRSVIRPNGRLKGLKGGRRTLGELNGGATFIRAQSPELADDSWLHRHRSWFIDKRIGGVTLHQAVCANVT